MFRLIEEKTRKPASVIEEERKLQISKTDIHAERAVKTGLGNWKDISEEYEDGLSFT